ncbi:hypothetical protein FFONT_0017 [Fervidicoccus fontis Kam940]|uniref:Uncharacterized protein n=1 Tax=Fervidicoccus fontis (strain DSM 19380 / JCM 18336 / VKM B-2539 / Kam940) TaxID=1163730 RepID=H9ZZ56_FERFK|nr:hypothetical protein FFONT_0017 [Fervidicoccus fontis Kam940]
MKVGSTASKYLPAHRISQIELKDVNIASSAATLNVNLSDRIERKRQKAKK